MKLYSITTHDIDDMPVKEKVKTIGVLCKQPGYRAYCQLKTSNKTLWLYDSTINAKEAKQIAQAATINCGNYISRFEWDEMGDTIRKDSWKDGEQYE